MGCRSRAKQGADLGRDLIRVEPEPRLELQGRSGRSPGERQAPEGHVRSGEEHQGLHASTAVRALQVRHRRQPERRVDVPPGSQVCTTG